MSTSAGRPYLQGIHFLSFLCGYRRLYGYLRRYHVIWQKHLLTNLQQVFQVEKIDRTDALEFVVAHLSCLLSLLSPDSSGACWSPDLIGDTSGIHCASKGIFGRHTHRRRGILCPAIIRWELDILLGECPSENFDVAA